MDLCTVSASDLLDGQRMMIVCHGLEVHIVVYKTMMRSYGLGNTVVVCGKEWAVSTFDENAPT
jgi:hypothetical protein